MIDRDYIEKTLKAIENRNSWSVSQINDPELGMRYFVQVRNPYEFGDKYLCFEVFEA